MSDEPNEGPIEPPPREPVQAPVPPPVRAPGDGPSTGQVLIGVFLVLFGVCITLAGGSCTLLWIIFVLGEGHADGGMLFLLSLAVLVGGLVTIWAGIKLVRGK
jgi:hypothetical protein